MRRLLIVAAAGLGLTLSSAARAADMPEKAPSAAPAAPSWTGFYLGGQFGGGWGARSVAYSGNDPASTVLIGGGFGGVGAQPVSGHNFNPEGMAGGIELGYNWQFAPDWVAGVEADFSASNFSGSSTATSVLDAAATQTVSSRQSLDWWGTVRGRLGWLAHKDVLLFGSAGFAYGRVEATDYYAVNGPPFAQVVGASSFSCTPVVGCFWGSSSGVKPGWTAGAGLEWRFSPGWSVKAEYLYINLGATAVTATALAAGAPGTSLSSYNADFGRTDYHIGRIGLNFQFNDFFSPPPEKPAAAN